jgi:integrase/recombinase XerD
MPKVSEIDREIIKLWLFRFADLTQKEYVHAIKALLAEVGYKSLAAIRLQDLQAHEITMRRSGLAEATRAKRLTAIKSLFSFASATLNPSGVGMSAYIPYNVAAAIPLPRCADDLAERILDEPTIASIMRVETDPVRRVLLRLFYASGGRISEVVNLRWEECHPHGEGGVISLTKTKGGRSRTVKLPATVWDELMTFRGDGTGYVFPSPRWLGQPIDVATAWRWFKAAARLAGVEASPHWFRHAHASHSLDRGAPIHLVARTLGHRSIATTTRYAHARPGESSGDYLVMPELPELDGSE